MSKCLTRCKDCIVHHYWNHMDDQEKSFLSVMIGDYVGVVLKKKLMCDEERATTLVRSCVERCQALEARRYPRVALIVDQRQQLDRRLTDAIEREISAVPKKFTNNIRGQIPEVVKLQVADGKTYDIQTAKEPNGLVFRSGWAKFASAYELEQGDMLVFRYSRNCLFKVQIFDPNGCEKEFSCFMVNNSSSVKGRCGHGMSKASHDNTICKECAAHHYWNQMHNRCSFVVMLDSGFKNGLILPKKYAKYVGDQISEAITLKVLDGETYDIEVTKKNNELLLCFGWAAFANAYELEQGDTLVFGYSGESHFEVRIFSPSTCEKELSCFPINSVPCVQERITSHDTHLQSPGSERRNKACTVCKDCISNHYWHHMSDQDKCFCKFMIQSDFKNKLTIPKKFATNVGEQILEEVQLEAPNGKIYNVKVAKEQNDLVIGTGWTKYASSHDLRLGDFLVFTYSGHAHFKVRIFDPSNCEKEFSSVVMDSSPYGQESSISHDNHTQPPTTKRSVTHCSGSSSHMRKTSKMSPTDSPSQTSTEDVDVEEPLNLVGFQKSFLVFPMGCNMTSEQKAKIDALEQKIRPQIPLYITAMDMTTMSGGFLAISKDYALKHLLDKDGTITVSQLNGSKTWTITLDTNTVGWYALSTGWLGFICDNGLKESDICIFEPSKDTRRVTLIFHPLEETHHPKSAGYVPSSISPPHEATEPGYIVPRLTVLNNEQMYKIKNKLQAIGSPYPVFVRIMKPSDVAGNYCCMRFSSEYDRKYLRHGYDTMDLMHPNKTCTWEAEIKITNNTRRLAQGWRQFVNDNELKPGDICLFQLMENKKLTMTVHIIRDGA